MTAPGPVAPGPEFARPVAVERLRDGEEVAVQASAAECLRLAARLGVPAVHAFGCRFRLLKAGPGGSLLVQGRLEAALDRDCVVTLEPFATTQVEAFEIRFVPAGREAEEDDPEAPDELGYEGGSIDLGEAAAEQLALMLDPYPRSPDAVLPEAATEPEPGVFSALAQLRRDLS